MTSPSVPALVLAAAQAAAAQATAAGGILAQVESPPLVFTPMTWAAFVLANAIIIAIIGPRLFRDLRRR